MKKMLVMSAMLTVGIVLMACYEGKAADASDNIKKSDEAASVKPLSPPNISEDKDLVLLLHLDGDATDSSGCGNNGSVIGEVKWVEGKQGKALSIDGKGGVLIPKSESLTIADQSWTIEVWIKPSSNQPTHSPILSTGFGNSIGYGLRISYLQNLYGQFQGGLEKVKGAGSGNVAAIIFDGKWHQAVLVLDRENGGQISVYLDGANVTAEQVTQSFPIDLKTNPTEIYIGLVNSSTSLAGYVGLIDEVRISRGVHKP